MIILYNFHISVAINFNYKQTTYLCISLIEKPNYHIKFKSIIKNFTSNKKYKTTRCVSYKFAQHTLSIKFYYIFVAKWAFAYFQSCKAL